MTTDTPTPEGVQTTLRDYLRVATATGELRGTRVEFSPDGGETWGEVLVQGHFLVAKATVYRAGWEIPTVLVAQWEEALPAEESWRALWNRKPQVLFGAFALRAALIRTFADVFGDRREDDDLPEGGTPPHVDAAPQEPTAPVDWLAELDAAESRADVASLYERAGKARVEPSIFITIQRRLHAMQADEIAEIVGADMVTAADAADAIDGAMTEVLWLERITAAQTDADIDRVRQALRADGAVSETLHAAMKRRTAELAGEPSGAIAHAMRDAVAKAGGKPTPLTVAARGARS